jgi:hypothetical protein
VIIDPTYQIVREIGIVWQGNALGSAFGGVNAPAAAKNLSRMILAGTQVPAPALSRVASFHPPYVNDRLLMQFFLNETVATQIRDHPLQACLKTRFLK